MRETYRVAMLSLYERKWIDTYYPEMKDFDNYLRNTYSTKREVKTPIMFTGDKRFRNNTWKCVSPYIIERNTTRDYGTIVSIEIIFAVNFILYSNNEAVSIARQIAHDFDKTPLYIEKCRWEHIMFFNKNLSEPQREGESYLHFKTRI
jgi:hypothetical protein